MEYKNITCLVLSVGNKQLMSLNECKEGVLACNLINISINRSDVSSSVALCHSTESVNGHGLVLDVCFMNLQLAPGVRYCFGALCDEQMLCERLARDVIQSSSTWCNQQMMWPEVVPMWTWTLITKKVSFFGN